MIFVLLQITSLRNYLLLHSLMHILRSKCHLVSYSILSKHFLVYFVNIVPPYLVRFVFILQIIRQLFLLSKIGLINLTTFSRFLCQIKICLPFSNLLYGISVPYHFSRFSCKCGVLNKLSILSNKRKYVKYTTID